MDCVKNAIMARVNFVGIYGMGVGYLSAELHKVWNEYWNNINSYSFEYDEPKTSGACGVLHNTNSSIYLHPMFTHFVLIDGGVKVNGSYFESDIKELTRLFDDCVKYINDNVDGANIRYTMKISKEETITFKF